MRSIRLKLPTQTKLILIEQDGINTLEQLWEVAESMNLGIDREKSKFIDYRTKVEYTNNGSALLPQGDCLLLMVPIKNDSGMENYIDTFLNMETIDDIKFIYDFNYNDLRKFGTALNNGQGMLIVNTRGTMRRMQDELVNFARSFIIPEEIKKSVVTEELDSTDDTLVSILDEAVITLEKARKLAENFNFIIGYTLQQLQDEHNKLIELNTVK